MRRKPKPQDTSATHHDREAGPDSETATQVVLAPTLVANPPEERFPDNELVAEEDWEEFGFTIVCIGARLPYRLFNTIMYSVPLADLAVEEMANGGRILLCCTAPGQSYFPFEDALRAAQVPFDQYSWTVWDDAESPQQARLIGAFRPGLGDAVTEAGCLWDAMVPAQVVKRLLDDPDLDLPALRERLRGLGGMDVQYRFDEHPLPALEIVEGE